MAGIDTLAVISAAVLLGPPFLHQPEALAPAPHGAFWVADRGEARLHLVTSDGEVASSFGASGLDGVEFMDRIALTDPAGQYIYVADIDASRIVKLTRNGVPVREIRMPQEPTAWPWKPRDICSLSDGRVFVADESSGRLAVTDAFDGLRWLGQDDQEGPGDVLVVAGLDCQDHVIVVSDGSGVLRFFDLHGNGLRQISVDGSPGSVCLRKDGLGAVVDESTGCIHMFKGSRMWGVLPRSFGTVRLLDPAGVCFGNDGALLVADRTQSCVLRIVIDEVE